MDTKNQLMFEETISSLPKLTGLNLYIDIRGLIDANNSSFWKKILNGKQQLASLRAFLTCTTSVLLGDEGQIKGINEHLEQLFNEFGELASLKQLLLVDIEFEAEQINKLVNKFMSKNKSLKEFELVSNAYDLGSMKECCSLLSKERKDVSVILNVPSQLWSKEQVEELEQSGEGNMRIKLFEQDYNHSISLHQRFYNKYMLP